jgi:NADH-quinone oxidoreductase subunit G
MAKQITLTIDGHNVTVPEGTLIVDAAKRIGIDIPVFCYHPKMEPVGMCRMCLVDIGRPVVDRASGQVVTNPDGSPKINFGPKLETACTTPVTEGMVVDGLSDKVRAARKDIIEFLLTSHPLDCPICDKGGECPLQNLTLNFGPGSSRFLLQEKMRLAKHLPLGDLIYLDRERCIQCGRCVRFQHEVVDDPVIAFYQRGRSLEIMTNSEPGFDSYFSGNTTDICPVGALTTADFRFEARPWEMKSAASICTHCPVGCNTTLNVRREARANGSTVVKRMMPRQNEMVNEIWMCDKGRFAYHYMGTEARLTAPLVRKDGELVEATWEEALSAAAEGLRAAGSNMISLAGGRLSNEDLFNLRQLAALQGGKAVLHSYMAGGELTAALGMAPGSNFTAMGKGSAIVVVASDLQEEAPIYYLRVKQAAERGATLIVINPRATKLDASATQVVRSRYGEEAALVAGLIPATRTPDVLQAAADALVGMESLVVIYGSEGVGLAGSAALANACAALLRASGHPGQPNNGLIGVWAHANDQGAFDLGFRPDPALETTLAQSTAVYLAAADPAGDSPALADALDRAGFVVVQELFLTETARRADVVFPVSAYIEREGTLTNAERRVQRYYPALPVRPGTLADYVITAQVAARLGHNLEAGSGAQVFQRLAAQVAGYAGLSYTSLAHTEDQWPIVGRQDMYYGGTGYDNHQGLGVQLPALVETQDLASVAGGKTETQDLASLPARPVAPAGALMVYPITKLYDHGTTVTPTKLLDDRLSARVLALHPDTAARFHLAVGVETQLTLNGVTAPVGVRLDDSLPLDVALLPRSLGLPIWEPVAITVNQPSAVNDSPSA